MPDQGQLAGGAAMSGSTTDQTAWMYQSTVHGANLYVEYEFQLRVQAFGFVPNSLDRMAATIN